MCSHVELILDSLSSPPPNPLTNTHTSVYSLLMWNMSAALQYLLRLFIFIIYKCMQEKRRS